MAANPKSAASNAAVGEPTTGDAVRRSTPGRVLSILLRGQRPVLLLGAGASVTSGVPAAGETVERAARWAWCQDNGRDPEDPAIRRSDYWDWMKRRAWYSDKKPLAELYPMAISDLLGVRDDRREFFVKITSPPVPASRGYRALARILSQGWITTVVTPNFDPCLQRGATLEGVPHHITVMKTSDDLVQFSAAPSHPQLIYIHGSVEHYTDKNLLDEVAALDQRLKDNIQPLLRDHPIVVVGYRGCEASVMQGLFLDQLSATNSFARGVYWCVLDREIDQSLPPMVQALADAIGPNFNLVPIAGFDDLFERELRDGLIAQGGQPASLGEGRSPAPLPPDMQVLEGADADALDQVLLFARLRQYAEKLRLPAPERIEAQWTSDMAAQFHLIQRDGASAAPTRAGWLLFSRDPASLVRAAKVVFSAEGPEKWLRDCFGEDVELTPVGEGGAFRVEREIGGNLWTQLDTLTDLLSLVNVQFRLKAEISRQVQPFAPLALKEMVVNALVHRDYLIDAPVHVNVSPDKITVTSPGGLIEDVISQMRGETLETAIRASRRGIKGYRNPAISDLFYGGGQMDRAGSGLSDMWKETVNNNGDVSFAPSEHNTAFIVTMWARPEAIDEITNTAIADVETERFAANLLGFHSLPDRVWHAGTSARNMGALRRAASGLAVPPGWIQDGRFYTFYNLEALAEELVSPFVLGDIETLNIAELLAQPGGGVTFPKLLHEALFDHMKALGLQLDYGRKRVHFAKVEGSEERKITYQARVRRATRTVVKARIPSGSERVLYYEHKALTFAVMQMGDEWALILSPGYNFTRDGVSKPISREKTNSLSTRRAAKDFNQNVHQDVAFWVAYLSRESEGVFALETASSNDFAKFAPAILLSNRLPSISFSTAAFSSDRELSEELDEDLDALEDELAALADEPEDANAAGDTPEEGGE